LPKKSEQKASFLPFLPNINEISDFFIRAVDIYQKLRYTIRYKYNLNINVLNQKGTVIKMIREDLRNIAIIAHVDHGKTTLVDEMLKQGGAYRENQATSERVMDSGDIEKERGITILAKNTSIRYGDVKINIIDTPGHADFGGEVERILKMVNGVLLLVDAAEGPMPQTRFVLERALELGHRVIVVINKIDKPDARLDEVQDEVLELLMELNATDEQLDSPMLFCSGRAGTASLSADVQGTDLVPLFEKIIDYIPAPEGDKDGPLQLLVSSIDYNEFVGRIGIGRIERGSIRQNQDVVITNYHSPDEPPVKTRIVSLYQFEALRREPCEYAEMGDIICFSGAENITIGDTICAPLNVEPLPFVKISEPVMEMTFSVNDGPLAGREGKLVTSRQIRSRLYRETLKDVSLRVRDGESADSFLVAGRGEMHLSILIETMRREGYELLVSAPRVLYKTDENGNKTEPAERVTIDVPEEYMGSVMEKLGSRKGTLIDMGLHGNRMRIQYVIPARCLFGYRSEFLTDTRGEGIINSIFEGYIPYQGEISTRYTGSLVASEDGESTSYALYSVQDRGDLFITVGEQVYMGMVIGENPKLGDICVNVCKQKHLTSIRSSGADEKLILTPPREMGLEKAIEFIGADELVEVTPKNIRLRKRILDTQTRLKTEARLKK